MRTLRTGACILAAFSVLAFGTVEIWSQTILEIGAAVLLLWWAVIVFRKAEAQIRWSACYWPLLIFVALVSGQLLFGATDYAFYTRVALMELLACAILFFLCGQAFRERRELRFFTWFLMCFAFATAIFGIVQSFTSNEKLYWVRPLTAGGNPFGPYVNRNHFAGLMELLSPIGLSLLLFRGVRREQMALVGLLTIMPIAALILSGSRGGIVSFLFELGFLAALVLYHKKEKLYRAAVAAVLLAALAAVGWLGTNRLFERFAQVQTGEASLERRWTMFVGTWHVFLDHPITGTGLGTLVDVYPRYETDYDGKIVDHAHNDYVELLAETGIAGSLCGLAFFWLFFRDAWARLGAEQSSFSLGLHAGAVTACAGMLVHSLVDFNFHTPSNGLFFLLMASLAVSPVLPPRTRVHST